MGRLMDSVMAALGLKPSDRVVISHEPINPQNLPPPPSQNSPATNTRQETNTDSAKSQDQPAPNVNISTSETKPQMRNVVENEQVPSEVTKEIKDCLSCRLIGGGVCFGASAYVTRLTYNTYEKYPKGIKRVAFIGQGLTITLLLLTLGVGRVFNIGYFNKDKADMTIKEHFLQDVEDLKNVMHMHHEPKISEEKVSVDHKS